MTTLEIELAVSKFFDVRRHLMVPNVSWGLGLHECDMLIVTKNGYANEVEIKINKYDLVKDQNKSHGHRSNLIRRLFFAIPFGLIEFKNEIPERAGIIVVYNLDDPYPGIRIASDGIFAHLNKPAQINKQARPLTNEQIIHLGRLASMRIWSLKNTLANQKGNHNPFIITYEE